MDTSQALLASQRQAMIRALLAREGRVLASQLSQTFSVSEDTIRRDLRELAARGECRRVYGGALPFAPDEGPFSHRQTLATLRKTQLARALARTIMPGSTLFIDAGSTNLAVAEALPADAGLTVVTNAPAIACALHDRSGLSVILLGGQLHSQSGACLGSQTLREAERIRPSALVLGACGVDAQAGVTAHHLEEAELKASLASRAASVLVAATAEKLGTAAAFCVVPTERITRLFVEHDCDAALLSDFEARGVSVVRADPEPEAAPATGMRRARSAA